MRLAGAGAALVNAGTNAGGGSGDVSLRPTLVGLAMNLALGLTKLTAGLLGNSSALIADAVESFSDVVGSLVVVHAVRVSLQPADEDHPYGHGKAEALGALAIGGTLLLAAVLIAVHAAEEIFSHREPPKAYTLWILLAIVVIKETLFRVTRRAAAKAGSTAVQADAWHHRADAITSLTAAAGIAVSVFGGKAWATAEDYAALVGAAMIIASALHVMREPMAELLDTKPDELVERVRTAAAGVPGARRVEKILARKSGRQYLVDMHLHVDPAMPVREAHALGGKVKATVREAVPQVRDVLIHLEPAEETHGP